MFQCGSIRTRKHLLAKVPEDNTPFEVPVPFFLIMHPDGNVLFITGQPLSAVNSTAVGDYIPVMKEAEHISRQLAKVGLKTADITHIVLSHLHSDHAGGLEAFEDAVCYVQAGELLDDNGRRMMDQYPLPRRLVSGDHDLFGDGRIKMIFTPGHSPGHQSLLLRLERTGGILLAADSVYLDEILENCVMPGNVRDHEAMLKTLARIMEMRRNGIRVISGHDPQSWAGFRLAPAYYE